MTLAIHFSAKDTQEQKEFHAASMARDLLQTANVDLIFFKYPNWRWGVELAVVTQKQKPSLSNRCRLGLLVQRWCVKVGVIMQSQSQDHVDCLINHESLVHRQYAPQGQTTTSTTTQKLLLGRGIEWGKNRSRYGQMVTGTLTTIWQCICTFFTPGTGFLG